MISKIDQYAIDAIRKARKAQKVSQAMLAYGIGKSNGFIGQVESSKCPTKYTLRDINEIAKYLGCSPRDFLPEKPL
ncbi:helix-turn-helix domain-containing protein [Alistipes sp.]|uniref:helix-turn-helix domain-containing protein n=1 Tax=Alistipes sp. TaxID=1872444 RepID=UPI003AEFE13D